MWATESITGEESTKDT